MKFKIVSLIDFLILAVMLVTGTVVSVALNITVVEIFVLAGLLMSIIFKIITYKKTILTDRTDEIFIKVAKYFVIPVQGILALWLSLSFL